MGRQQYMPAIVLVSLCLLLCCKVDAQPRSRGILSYGGGAAATPVSYKPLRKLAMSPAPSPAAPGNPGSSSSSSSNASAARTGAGSSQGFPRSAGMLHPDLRELLVAVQQARLYNDSKTAVDLVLLVDPPTLAAAAAPVLAAGGGKEQLAALLAQYTSPAGSDVQECPGGPADWQPEPPGFLARLLPSSNATGNATGSSPGGADEASQLRRFGLQVHGLWKVLCREVTPSVSSNPERHSLFPLRNQQVVPGDRFRETYYWDSYWVVRGLLVSGMPASAAALVDNLLQMLGEVGHVPNGARVYYLNRSQPPLLSAMVREVVEATNNTSLLTTALPLLIREHEFWTTGPKAVQLTSSTGQTYRLSRYYADLEEPRPESYREDAELGAQLAGSTTTDGSNATTSGDASEAAVRQLYRDLASGAESGWDFSSRWFADGRNISTIQTTKVVPADLNAWLYQMERNLAWAANVTGDAATSQRFNQEAAQRREAMMALLWDDSCGCWRDGILQGATGNATTDAAAGPLSLSLSQVVAACNYVPLWAGLTEGQEGLGPRVVQSLQASGLVQTSGIATTLTETGQQWDFPNGWPPLQHMLVAGAARYGGQLGQQLAAQVADAWVRNNKAIYDADGYMHEKYDVTRQGRRGGGGEYAPQVGFGWSNGVVLDFLDKYVTLTTS